MTKRNKNLAITEELRRSKDALKAAELLMQGGLAADAVSKLYYYLLYHMRALLLTKELEPRSHEGVLRLFGLHFVKPGIFDTKTSHVLSKMMKFREEADYNPLYSFTEDDYKEFKSDVSAVADAVKKYLAESGYL